MKLIKLEKIVLLFLLLASCSQQINSIKNKDVKGFLGMQKDKKTAPVILALTREQAIQKYLTGRQLSPAEGIWVWSDNTYEVLITKNTLGIHPDYDYLGILTYVGPNRPLWKKGEIKILLRETATNTLLSGIYFMGNKSKERTTFLLSENNNLIRLNLRFGALRRKEETILIRSYPKDAPLTNKEKVTSKEIYTSGTGILYGESKLVITNYHVVKGTSKIQVRFINNEVIDAQLIAKDPENDLAVLKLNRTPSLRTREITFGDSSSVRIGEQVFTIGFPFIEIMGVKPKYTEGVISALTGVQDNPTLFQTTVPIQPGNSGGPLFNEKGEIIGLATASLSLNSFNSIRSVPQNVNYAIKSSFVKNIMATLPEAYLSNRGIVITQKTNNSREDFIEDISNNIVLITGKVD